MELFFPSNVLFNISKPFQTSLQIYCTDAGIAENLIRLILFTVAYATQLVGNIGYYVDKYLVRS